MPWDGGRYVVSSDPLWDGGGFWVVGFAYDLEISVHDSIGVFEWIVKDLPVGILVYDEASLSEEVQATRVSATIMISVYETVSGIDYLDLGVAYIAQGFVGGDIELIIPETDSTITLDFGE